MVEQRGHLRQHAQLLEALFRLMDIGILVGAYVLAKWLHPETEVWRHQDTTLMALTAILFLFAADNNRLYGPWRGASVRDELVRTWSVWTLVVPTLLFFGFIAKVTDDYSRIVVSLWFVLAPTGLCALRLALRFSLHEARRQGHNTRTTAIVGATDLGERVAREIMRPHHGMRFAGFYDDRMPERCHPMGDDVGGQMGTLDDLVEAARAGEVDLVYIALPLRAEPRINDIVRKLADTTATVYMAADFDAFDLLYARWGSIGGVPVVSIHETPFYGVGGTLKRIEDLVLGSIIMSIIALPMAIIAIGVKLSSPGPVFFRQRRYGLNGEVIDVLKFRSMRVAEDGPVVRQATKDDPRVTRFGAFIRRTSLDELPQFIHVLTGKMSIVGPRPHAIAHNEMYRRKIQGYMLRHKVKPGITGWAQVNGWRGETDTLEKMEKRIEHDLDYIRNWDLMWDIKIIFLTVFGSAVRRNAY